MRFCDARVQSRASLSLVNAQYFPSLVELTYRSQSVVEEEEEEETEPETEDSGSEMTTEQLPENTLAVTTTPTKTVIVRQRSLTNVVIVGSQSFVSRTSS